MQQRLDLRPGKGVVKTGARITAIVMEDGTRYTGRMFIDATYEGDLMAKAGVKYTTGREANSLYDEKYNGVEAAHRHEHQFPDGLHVSPYVRLETRQAACCPASTQRDPAWKVQAIV
jgi:hypothetical protein